MLCGWGGVTPGVHLSWPLLSDRIEVGNLGYQAGTMGEHSGRLAFCCLSFPRFLPQPLKHAEKASILTIGIWVPGLLIGHDPGCGIIDLSRDREEG